MSNALVPLARSAQPALSSRTAGRAKADFVAHLIATRIEAPQTRARRRAEPQHAVAAYGAVGQWPTPAGRTLSRSL